MGKYQEFIEHLKIFKDALKENLSEQELKDAREIFDFIIKENSVLIDTLHRINQPEVSPF